MMVDTQGVSGPRRPGAEWTLRCRDLTFGSWRSLGPWFSMIALRYDRKLRRIAASGFVY